MHDEIRGLTGVDARGIDPQRTDPPLLDQKTRGFLTVGGKCRFEASPGVSSPK